MLLAFIALALIYLMPLTTGLWFLAVIVLVVLRGQGLVSGWRWLSGALAAQWLAISVFHFVLWFNLAPLEAYIATTLGLGAAGSLTIFSIRFPSDNSRPRDILMSIRLSLTMVSLAVLSTGILLLTSSFYSFF